MNRLTNRLGHILSGLSPSPSLPVLGERELEVLKIFWQGDVLSAKQVLQCLPDSELSLSSMQSTLERLHRKNFLHREKVGRFFVYRALLTRAEVISQLMEGITEQICDGDMAPMVSGFTNFCSQKISKPKLDARKDNEGQSIHSK